MNLQYIPKKKIILLVGDIVAIATSVLCAPVIRFGVLVFEPLQLWREMVAILLIALFCFYIADLYNLESKMLSSGYIYRFIGANIASTGLAMVANFFITGIDFGRGLLTINVILILLFTGLWRILFHLLFKKILNMQRTVLIIGAGKAGYEAYGIMEGIPTIKVAGFIDDDTKKHNDKKYPKVLGDHNKLYDVIRQEGVDQIIIAIKDIKNPELFKHMLNCKMKGVQIYTIPSLYELILGKIQVEHVTDYWFLNFPIAGVRKSIYNTKIKRLIGILLALFFLILGLPIIIVTALAIKLDSKGPVFYKQNRVGLNDQVFRLVKFRSMTVNAEANGAVWAAKEDSRVTRVGKIIRKLRIDEIPQMWNVLKGDMNFFGPRPERPEFVEMLKEKVPYYELRHAVKPGITGWAQVNYPYGASVEDALEKLKYDLFYIKNLSPFLDFHILLRTVRVVLFGKGAR